MPENKNHPNHTNSAKAHHDRDDLGQRDFVAAGQSAERTEIDLRLQHLPHHDGRDTRQVVGHSSGMQEARARAAPRCTRLGVAVQGGRWPTRNIASPTIMGRARESKTPAPAPVRLMPM